MFRHQVSIDTRRAGKRNVGAKNLVQTLIADPGEELTS